MADVEYSIPSDIDVSDGEFERRRQATLHSLQQLNRRRRKVCRRRSASSDNSSSEGEMPSETIIKLPILTPNGSTPNDNISENGKPKEKLDPALVGMSAGLKHLYSGKEDRRGRFQWQTTIPVDVGEPAEDAETQKWALIVRHVKVYLDPTKVLGIHSIVIQSPLLKELLEEVLAGYPGVTVGLDRLEFSGRFEPLIHRWAEFTAAVEELRDSVDNRKAKITQADKSDDADGSTDQDSREAVKLQHATLLQKLLVSELQDAIDASQDMTAKGVMTYDYLWTLFQPGALVYSKQEGQDRLFKLQSGRYGTDRDGNPVFWLMLQYVDWDGNRFGTQKLNLFIRAYNGTRRITSLSSSPLAFHHDREQMQAKLLERATKVEAFAGVNYRAYEGMGWRMGTFGKKEKYSVKGRIVIDTHGWNKYNANSSIYVTPLREDGSDIDTIVRTNRDSDDEYEDANNDMDGGMPIDGHFGDDDDQIPRQALKDDQKLLCTHLVRGYALKEKLWLNLYVNSVKEINFNTRAFDSLVLPESQKELILGFTETQQALRNAFDDVIEGKGRGSVWLLSGPPGVGKTLTAESVAEETKVPLYMMSAGDLGLDSRHIESRLQGVFEMVTRWNAILLLDEADVFLEERSLHELERNKLVSIFLRVLEYYEGIMFLTTNRVQTFDAAFQSRIHISLDYPELSIDSRKQVWRNFLAQHDAVQQAASDKGRLKSLTSSLTARKANAAEDIDETTSKDAANNKDNDLSAQPHALTSREIDSLAQMRMNGRQIKNVLKTAQLLATRRREPLGRSHILQVLDVTQHLHNATKETERARSAIFN